MKSKPTNQGKQPKGSILPTFESKGVKWTCTKVDVPNNIFKFESDNGLVEFRKWDELGDNIKIR
jgi:hypothetical protein